MPIKAYVGQMRSGKTYEVVSNVILGGLRDGRRVVSNIAGLNYEAMRDMLLEEGVPVEKIGELICVDHEQVAKPSFWRTDKDEAVGFEPFIQLGDLLALDEVWRFWKKRGDIEPRAMNFIRMHGHMPHPVTGYVCEIALISQLISDINENVRGVIQETYRMTKLTAVGMDKRYRVDIFGGGSVSRREFLRQLQRTYETKYFALYNSHSQNKSGVSVVEKNIDTRANILRGALFKLVLPLALLLGIAAVWAVLRFFKSPASEKPDKPGQVAEQTAAPAGAAADKPKKSGIDEVWRLSGFYQTGTRTAFVLLDASNRTRIFYDPPNFKLSGWQMDLALPEGGFATGYSGSAPAGAGLIVGDKK